MLMPKMTQATTPNVVGVPRRFLWLRVLGATRPGRLPRVPGGVPWESPMKGKQCPSEWLAAGGDLTGDRSSSGIEVGARPVRYSVPRVLGFDRKGFKICSAEGAPRTHQAEKATCKSDQSGKVYRCTVPGICWSERVGHQHKPPSISGRVQVRDASCTGDMSGPNRRSPARHKCTSGRLLGHHRVLGDEYLARQHVAVATCRTLREACCCWREDELATEFKF
ncbi:hypothetical protein TIFTF001_018829 [Ficus carica]|uniref:Uncharacterized protein n=1 Tax=Ficus carica TaxID=3494 RepID=A0AA88DC22_FICCA|nr:hypothetical protein TIFTF001_018829 [Ficus carica]